MFSYASKWQIIKPGEFYKTLRRSIKSKSKHKDNFFLCTSLPESVFVWPQAASVLDFQNIAASFSRLAPAAPSPGTCLTSRHQGQFYMYCKLWASIHHMMQCNTVFHEPTQCYMLLHHLCNNNVLSSPSSPEKQLYRLFVQAAYYSLYLCLLLGSNLNGLDGSNKHRMFVSGMKQNQLGIILIYILYLTYVMFVKLNLANVS